MERLACIATFFLFLSFFLFLPPSSLRRSTLFQLYCKQPSLRCTFSGLRCHNSISNIHLPNVRKPNTITREELGRKPHMGWLSACFLYFFYLLCEEEKKGPWIRFDSIVTGDGIYILMFRCGLVLRELGICM